MTITNHSEQSNLYSKDLTSADDGSTLKEPSPGGSLFIYNNTSYAGADIKVVVNNYDTGDAVKEKVADLEYQLDKVFDEIDFYDGQRESLVFEFSTEKKGTPAAKSTASMLSKLDKTLHTLRQTLQSLMDKIHVLRSGMESNPSKVLAEIQTLSLSSHRGKSPVRAFGTTYAKAYARGARTLAGSMIFAVFNEHVLYRFLEAHASDFDGENFSSALLDQLPPIDITVAFANEYGSVSRLAIYGVEFVNEGQTMSIEDIMTENVVNYVARDYDPMRAVAHRKLDAGGILMSEWQGKKGSDLIMEDEFQNTKDMLDPFHRFAIRSKRFI